MTDTITVLARALLVLILGSPFAPAGTFQEEDQGHSDPPSGAHALAPRLCATGNGLILSWLEPGPKEDHWQLRFARFDGRGWSKASDPIIDRDDLFVNWADVPGVVEDAGGALFAHWLQQSGPETYAYDVQIARSTDDGRSWKRLGKLHDDATRTEHGFVSYAASAGGLLAVWLDGRETVETGGAMTLRAGLLGKSQGRSELLDARVCDCCGTAAAWTDSGPIVVYRDRDENEVRDIACVRRTDTGWTPPVTVHDDGWTIPGCPVNGPALAARGKSVAVAWFTGAGAGQVRLAFSDDAGANFSFPLTVHQGGDGTTPLGRVDLLLTDGGDAIVSWIAQHETGAELAVRRLRRNGAAGARVAVADISPSRQAGFPQLERFEDDLILVWTDASEGAGGLRSARVPLKSLD